MVPIVFKKSYSLFVLFFLFLIDFVCVCVCGTKYFFNPIVCFVGPFFLD